MEDELEPRGQFQEAAEKEILSLRHIERLDWMTNCLMYQSWFVY
jgi:hypothetical protein